MAQTPSLSTYDTSKIVCVIACHISAPEHVTYFDQMLDSVQGQVIAPSRVLISISKDPSTTYPVIRTTLPAHIEIYHHNVLMSQFEHYSYLLTKLDQEDPHTCWVCFGDADG